MKKILLGLFGLGAVAVLGVLGAASTQPDTIRVQRSVEVQASTADVWPYAADLRHFVRWSPWEGRDPDQVAEFSDPSAGVGAWYTWRGNEEVGSGRMSIKAVEEHRLVVEDLEFVEPWENMAEVRLALEPAGDGTRVTWSFESPAGLLTKVACLFLDMDALMGADFEKGLARLAELAEADGRARLEAEARARAEAEQEAAGDTGADEAQAAAP